MSHEERADLLLLKARIELYLDRLNEEIITFDSKGDDNEFRELIKKAEYYVGISQRIQNQLTND